MRRATAAHGWARAPRRPCLEVGARVAPALPPTVAPTAAASALDRAGAEAVCVAPNVAQTTVLNHLTGDAMPGESRNVWVDGRSVGAPTSSGGPGLA